MSISALLIMAVDLGVAFAAQLDAMSRVASVLAREAGGQGQFGYLAFLFPAERQIGIHGPALYTTQNHAVFLRIYMYH